MAVQVPSRPPPHRGLRLRVRRLHPLNQGRPRPQGVRFRPLLGVRFRRLQGGPCPPLGVRSRRPPVRLRLRVLVLRALLQVVAAPVADRVPVVAIRLVPAAVVPVVLVKAVMPVVPVADRVPVAAPAVPVVAPVALVAPVPADVRVGNVDHRAVLGVGVVAATRMSCNHNS